MFGRAAYNDPWILSKVDEQVFGDPENTLERDDIIKQVIEFAERCETEDKPAKAIIRHVMGIYAGEPGARLWRRTLSEGLAAGLLPSDILKQGLETRRPSRDAA